eukprot:15434609-Alexandrium_andersonii.AAC.1
MGRRGRRTSVRFCWGGRRAVQRCTACAARVGPPDPAAQHPCCGLPRTPARGPAPADPRGRDAATRVGRVPLPRRDP